MSTFQKFKGQSQESPPLFEEILQRASARAPCAANGEEGKRQSASHTQTGYGVEEHLTPREFDVLKLIARGESSKQVAQTLGITFRTARSHRSNLMEKLGMHETSALVRYAIRTGLIRA